MTFVELDSAITNDVAIAIDVAVSPATSDRRLFVTEQGYIAYTGLGPCNMTAGDLLHDHLWGVTTPFFLRSEPTTHVDEIGNVELQALDGDCYVTLCSWHHGWGSRGKNGEHGQGSLGTWCDFRVHT